MHSLVKCNEVWMLGIVMVNWWCLSLCLLTTCTHRILKAWYLIDWIKDFNIAEKSWNFSSPCSLPIPQKFSGSGNLLWKEGRKNERKEWKEGGRKEGCWTIQFWLFFFFFSPKFLFWKILSRHRCARILLNTIYPPSTHLLLTSVPFVCCLSPFLPTLHPLLPCSLSFSLSHTYICAHTHFFC